MIVYFCLIFFEGIFASDRHCEIMKVCQPYRYGPWIRGGLDQEGFLTKVKMRKHDKK